MLPDKRPAGYHLEAPRADKGVQLHQCLLVGTIAIYHHHDRRRTVGLKILHPLQRQGSHMAAIHRHGNHRQRVGLKVRLFRHLQGRIYKTHLGKAGTTNNRLTYLFGSMCRRKSNQINRFNSHKFTFMEAKISYSVQKTGHFIGNLKNNHYLCAVETHSIKQHPF